MKKFFISSCFFLLSLPLLSQQNAISGKVEAYDIQATILNQLGFNHEEFTYPYQGRPFRLTDVAGKVIQEIIA